MSASFLDAARQRSADAAAAPRTKALPCCTGPGPSSCPYSLILPMPVNGPIFDGLSVDELTDEYVATVDAIVDFYEAMGQLPSFPDFRSSPGGGNKFARHGHPLEPGSCAHRLIEHVRCAINECEHIRRAPSRTRQPDEVHNFARPRARAWRSRAQISHRPRLGTPTMSQVRAYFVGACGFWSAYETPEALEWFDPATVAEKMLAWQASAARRRRHRTK